MTDVVRNRRANPADKGGDSAEVPAHVYFLVSAVFHYVGPAFAVLLFHHIAVLGVAWLRIGSAAGVFAAWRRPVSVLVRSSWVQRRTLIALGIVVGLMNVCFYVAIARLPLSTVGSIEFLGPLTLAAVGVRTRRNGLALLVAIVGAILLSRVRLANEPVGFLLAFGNCALFMLYVMLGHRIARDGGSAGIDRLSAAMLIALLTVTPIGLVGAAPAFTHPELLLAGIGVGVCSSVIPYVCDQLALAQLPRATFALLLSILPASAAVIGVFVLRQIPQPTEIAGIVLIIIGVAIHHERDVRN
jgi:inner membrane transporter RhtA